MANSPGQPPAQRLPIKLIMPKQGVERKVSGGGGSKTPFRPVSRTYREGLANQVGAVERALLPALNKVRAAPVRVRVIAKATAKSHRPEQLFSEKTCPIIGAGQMGELFVKATPEGLQNLNTLINQNDSERIIRELSCVETIEAVTPKFRRRGKTSKDILRHSPRRGNGFVVKIRLFDLDDRADQQSLVSEFKRVCEAREITWSQRGYNEHSQVYSVECRTVKDVDALSQVVGIRAIARMPRIRTVRPRSIGKSTAPEMTARAEQDKDVPVVVVVDSGVTSTVPALNTWVVGRTEDVAPAYSNKDHGTFVAALVCWGHSLNPSLPGINNEPCAVYDLQVIPNDDPEKGDVDDIYESEFLESLESALKQLANQHKVWNLSLGTDEICSLDEFSELAEQLDNLQERYAVSFVIAAGNYEIQPLLNYPRQPEQLSKGRITTPADSVLGIAVGSVAHEAITGQSVASFEPSPFSRHGAGPNHIIKPDFVHFGGTCSFDGSTSLGVQSIVENGNLIEDIGTSFAAPLVSRSLAQIYHQITPNPSPVLARALLTHHARDPRNGSRVSDSEVNFFGFGRPEPVPYCLECSAHTATLVFDDVLRPGYFLEWDDFPYPPSLLRDGRYHGEIWMTVAFAPTRGARWGTEYCETHISAHLGVYHDQKNRTTGVVKQKFKGLVPPEHRNPGELYESHQVEHLRKWAPVRTYHGAMGETGQRGNRWRLKLQLLTRHNITDSDIPMKPQPFSVIITIADPDRGVDVYDEMSRIVRNRFKAENLAIRPRTQIQTRP